MKRKSILLLAACLVTIGLAAQELKVVDNKFMLDKTVVAEVKKLNTKIDLLAGGKSLLFCEEKTWSYKYYVTGTTDDTFIWYVFRFPEGDSTQLDYSAFGKEVSLPLFGPNSKTFAKLYSKLGLVNTDGTLNKEAVQKFRAKYTENISEQIARKAADENTCKASVKEIAPRDTHKDVEVTEASRTEVDPGKEELIVYEIRQDNMLIGKVEVKGHPKALKSESAEYDFSPGILSLDKDYGTANYEFKNANGCRVAWYITNQRLLFTYKDQTKTPVSKIVNTNSLQSRQDFVISLAKYIVQSGCL